MKTKPKLAAVPSQKENAYEPDHAAIAKAIVERLPTFNANADDDSVVIAATEIESAMAGIEPLLRAAECEVPGGPKTLEPYFEAIRELAARARSAASNLRFHSALFETGEFVGAPNYKGGAK